VRAESPTRPGVLQPLRGMPGRSAPFAQSGYSSTTLHWASLRVIQCPHRPGASLPSALADFFGLSRCFGSLDGLLPGLRGRWQTRLAQLAAALRSPCWGECADRLSSVAFQADSGRAGQAPGLLRGVPPLELTTIP